MKNNSFYYKKEAYNKSKIKIEKRTEMIQDIGKKIKELRGRKKLTLKDVSEQTQLSIGFLSQLERGLTSIAADSLARIAQVLDVEAAYFFPRQPRGKKAILRSYEKELFQIENGRFLHYHLTNDAANREMLPRFVELLPINSDETIQQYGHDGEEFIYVLEGTLTLALDGQEYEMFPGDSAHYSSQQHNWSNHTGKIVRLLVVGRPNPFKT